MGCTQSTQQDKDGRARNYRIERQLWKEQRQEADVVKLLLLGIGESGKSTIAKQMRIIHESGFTPEEHEQFRPVIYSNMIQSLLVILRAMKDLGIEFTSIGSVEDADDFRNIAIDTPEGELPPELPSIMGRLWGDDGLQSCVAQSSKYQLNDSAAYYLDSLRRISQPDYTPSVQDILRARVRTTGIVETKFRYKDLQFRLFDVGGQRTERKKWIHCFDDVTCVIFCVSLSGYDLVLLEDQETNQMVESMTLFNSISNNVYFQKTSMILFLNKFDIFKEKVPKVPITVCFPEYDGPNTVEDSADYIAFQFESLNKCERRDVITHFTSATNTDNIQVVFDGVTKVIMDKNLKSFGMY